MMKSSAILSLRRFGRPTRRHSSSLARIFAVSACCASTVGNSSAFGVGFGCNPAFIGLVESLSCHPASRTITRATRRQHAGSHCFPSNHHSTQFHPVSSRYRTATRRYSSNNAIASTDDPRSAINNLPRIYIGSSSSTSASFVLTKNAIVPLNDNHANYLNVMRITNPKRWGALAGHVRIFNGSDGEWLAKIVVAGGGGGAEDNDSGKRKKNNRRRDPSGGTTVVECVEQLRPQSESSTSSSSTIHLHIGRLKKPRRKWVLEKATELGVDEIHVVDTEFSSTMDAWEYDKHWMQVVEAAEQCERLTLPILVETPSTWESLLDRMDEEGENPGEQWLICRERSPDSLPLWQALSSSQGRSNSSSIAYHVLVGPEGGWSPAELVSFEDLRQRKPDRVHFVSLGSLILRAETAAIAAVSAVALAQNTHPPTSKEYRLIAKKKLQYTVSNNVS